MGNKKRMAVEKFRLIRFFVSPDSEYGFKNHRMHLNPLYDQKLVSGNLRSFEKNDKRIGKHSVMAQIKARFTPGCTLRVPFIYESWSGFGPKFWVRLDLISTL